MPEFHDYPTVRQFIRSHVGPETYRRIYKKLPDTKLIEFVCNHQEPEDHDGSTVQNKFALPPAFTCLAQEHDWATSNKPYYNVYPIMQELISNTKLDISPAFISLPYNTMLFRFQKGHEPFGIKATLVSLGVPASIRMGGSKMDTQTLYDKYSTCPRLAEQNIAFDGKFLTAAPVYYTGGLHGVNADYSVRPLVLQVPLGIDDIEAKETAQMRRGPVFKHHSDKKYLLADPTEELPEWLHWQFFRGPSAIPGMPETAAEIDTKPESFAQLELLDDTFKRFDPTLLGMSDGLEDRFSPEEARCSAEEARAILDFHMKLVALVSLLHNGDADKIVEPILLKKYEKKYQETDDEARKQWFIRKSAEVGGGRGFTVGKGLQEKSVTQPHIRNAHWAVYWTGTGRKIPKLLKRSVAFIAPKLLTSVPTGFMKDSDEQEQTQTPVEYVYLCRDKTQNLVKIGRTKRKVEDRVSASQTWVPGGLELIGYLATGDSVALETRLHRQYAEKRRTNEFFELSEDDIKAILSGASV